MLEAALRAEWPPAEWQAWEEHFSVCFVTTGTAKIGLLALHLSLTPNALLPCHLPADDCSRTVHESHMGICKYMYGQEMPRKTFRRLGRTSAAANAAAQGSASGAALAVGAAGVAVIAVQQPRPRHV